MHNLWLEHYSIPFINCDELEALSSLVLSLKLDKDNDKAINYLDNLISSRC